MFDTETPIATRRMRAAAVMLAALLLPISFACAQTTNVRAVAERLERAVKAGEMTIQFG